MEETKKHKRDSRAGLLEMRDWLGVGVRHRRIGTLSFLIVFLCSALFVFTRAPRYLASSRILVKHERQDPAVSADSSTTPALITADVTDVEVNSEVELIKSRDLAEDVVKACGLVDEAPATSWLARLHLSRGPKDPQKVLASAITEMEARLKVAPLPKSNLISITYTGSTPQRAAAVLNTLVNLYLEKHMAVHGTAGTFEFFQKQTQRYEEGLKVAQTRLVEFNKQNGVVSPEQQKNSTLQKLSEFQAELKQTQTSIAEIQQRIQNLEAQSATTPSRVTSQVREADNPQLMEQLKSTMLSLQMKRTELLQKFEPTYRLVQEVDAEIVQTQNAIEAAEKSKLKDETTDRNPIYDWMRSELAHSRSELAAQQARAQAITQSVRSYEQQASSLDQSDVTEQSLLRDEKSEETNYLLYLHKQEEARITEALDRNRILNVAVVEKASPPPDRTGSHALDLIVGFLGAMMAGVTVIAASEYLNPSLRTSDEIIEFLDLPVLASISGTDR